MHLSLLSGEFSQIMKSNLTNDKGMVIEVGPGKVKVMQLFKGIELSLESTKV